LRSHDDVDLLHGDAPRLRPESGHRNFEFDGSDHAAPNRDGRVHESEGVSAQWNIFKLNFALNNKNKTSSNSVFNSLFA
jgi:hypothetical protein